MSKIKTRETEKDIKVLDKAGVAGQRMKSAFVRSKARAAALTDDHQTTPSEYAADQVEFTAERAVYDTENAALLGVRSVNRLPRNVKVEGVQKMRTPPPVDVPMDIPLGLEAHSAPALGGGRFQSSTGVALEGRHPLLGLQGPEQPLALPVPESAEHTASYIAGRNRAITTSTKKPRLRQDHPLAPPAPGNGTSNHTMERSQDLTRTLTRKRVESIGPTAYRAPDGARRPVQNIKQAIKGRNAAKHARQNTKTAEYASKSTKTAGHAAATTPKALQAPATAARTVKTSTKTAMETVAMAARKVISAAEALGSAMAAGGWVVMLVVVVICLIGLLAGSCFGIFFAGEDSGTGQPVSSAVREINQKYADRLDEIKAINPHDILEMSGSRAVWPEVLAVYAVKTTTDADDPQEVATMDDSKKALLTEIFWVMNQLSYSTSTTSHDVMVEGADGEETTVTVTETTLYITVTHKTADEAAAEYGFTADQLEQLRELLAAENDALWLSVLYGITGSDGDIVAVALSQIGNIGGEPYWSWYGFTSRVEWCACFVSWCANECGYVDAGVIPKFASCASGMAWFQERGQWADNSIEPVPGTLIFFDWDGESGQDGVPNHVGIVEKVEDGRVYTVEGNSGDGCRERSYAIGYYEILGYGLPAY